MSLKKKKNQPQNNQTKQQTKKTQQETLTPDSGLEEMMDVKLKS